MRSKIIGLGLGLARCGLGRARFGVVLWNTVLSHSSS